MTEEAARAADGGLSNASLVCGVATRPYTKDAARYEPGCEECGGVPSRRDGRLWSPCGAMGTARRGVAKQRKKTPRFGAYRAPEA